jgi:hypothetical protein
VQFSATILEFDLRLNRNHESRGNAANMVRGGLGYAFRKLHCRPDCLEASQCPHQRQCLYAKLFEADLSKSTGSGFRDPPRPFVLRVAEPEAIADQQTGLLQMGRLQIRLHLFVRDPSLIGAFGNGVKTMAAQGFAFGKLKVSEFAETPPRIVTVPLDALESAPEQIRIDFLSPTELKHEGQLLTEPHFLPLLNRARDRILFLMTQYTPESAGQDHGPLAVKLAEAAAQVRLIDSSIERVSEKRTSTRTGQTHPLGGFVGTANYEGDFRLLLPWLLAAELSGVGRQTVWGKGAIRIGNPKGTPHFLRHQ